MRTVADAPGSPGRPLNPNPCTASVRARLAADVTADGHARLSYRQANTLWKTYPPGRDLHQLRHTAISARAAGRYNEIELKRFSRHQSLQIFEVYIAHNREPAKPKARDWQRRDQAF